MAGTSVGTIGPVIVAEGLLAADIMIRFPKVLPARATVSEVRIQLRDDHVHMVLLTEGGLLVGTVVSGDVPPAAPDAGLALPHARLAARTVPSDQPARDAAVQLHREGQRRLAVTHDGELVGLICLNRRLSGFCADQDVEARAEGSGLARK